MYKVSKRLSIGLLVLVAAGALFFLIRRHSASSALMPFQFIQLQSGIGSVKFSSDGHLLMTVDEESHLVTFRDPATGRIVRQWPGGGEQTWLSENGQRFLEADPVLNGPTRCILRDAMTGRALRQWTGQILDVLPDLSLMVAADDYRTDLPFGYGTTGRVVDVPTGRVIGTFLRNESTTEPRFSRDRRFLCLQGEAALPARLLRVPSLTPVLPLPPLAGLHVSKDGGTVVGTGWKGDLQLWSLPSRRHTVIATGLSLARWAYSLPDGTLAVAGETGTGQNRKSVLQVRSADGVRLLRSLPETLEYYSANGRFMASLTADKQGENGYDVYDLQTGRRLAALNALTDALGQPTSRSGLDQAHLAVAPDGRRFVLASDDGLLRFYDLAQAHPPASQAPIFGDSGRALLSFSPGSGYGPSVLDAVTLPGGGVAAGGADTKPGKREVQVWQAGRDVQAVTANVSGGDRSHLGVSPNGGMLAEVSRGEVWTLDLAHGQMAVSSDANGTSSFQGDQVGYPVWLEGAQQPFSVVSVGLFGNEPIVLTRRDAAGREIAAKTIVPAGETVNGQSYQLGGMQVSPDGGLLAVLWNCIETRTENGKPIQEMTSDGMMELRETRTGRLVRTLLARQRAGTASLFLGAFGTPVFSPDGRLLAVADQKGRALVYEVTTGKKIAQMSGMCPVDTSLDFLFVSRGFGSNPCLAFSPDDQLLAAARDDGSIYLYSLRTLLPVAQIGCLHSEARGSYRPMAPAVGWLAFDAQGKTLYGIVQNSPDVLSWKVPSVP